MPQPIQTPRSPIGPSTWYWPPTATPLTYRRPSPEAAKEVISSWPETSPSLIITVPFTPSPKSSRPSCNPWQRRNSVLSTSTVAKQSRRDIYSKRWDIVNLQPQCKSTTPPRWVSSLKQSSRNGPKPWIFVSTGCVAVQISANSEPTGAWDRLTKAIMSQNIMQLHITKMLEQII